jgi:hypothetical protein
MKSSLDENLGKRDAAALRAAGNDVASLRRSVRPSSAEKGRTQRRYDATG